MLHRRTAALLAALLAVALAGCGGKSDDEQVRDTLARFEQATKKGDYKALCGDLLSEELVKRLQAVQLPCPLALQQGLGGVLQPSIDVQKVRVRKDVALAQVTSTAVGQPPSHDTIRLVREGDRWRVASLSGAQPPAPARQPNGQPEPQ